MPFERFKFKGGGRELAYPGVRLTPSGWCYINAWACTTFEMPEKAFVFFHFNFETNEVGLEIINEKAAGAYSLPSRKVVGRTCKPKSFIKYWGIDCSDLESYELREVEDEGRKLLVFGPVKRTEANNATEET